MVNRLGDTEPVTEVLDDRQRAHGPDNNITLLLHTRPFAAAPRVPAQLCAENRPRAVSQDVGRSPLRTKSDGGSGE